VTQGRPGRCDVSVLAASLPEVDGVPKHSTPIPYSMLKRAAIGHMRKLSKLPGRVRNFFGHKTIRYAA
jgi:hypothetical protein